MNLNSIVIIDNSLYGHGFDEHLNVTVSLFLYGRRANPSLNHECLEGEQPPSLLIHAYFEKKTGMSKIFALYFFLKGVYFMFWVIMDYFGNKIHRVRWFGHSSQYATEKSFFYSCLL